MLTDKQLTAIYKSANSIVNGKTPPITTESIFTAMQACYQQGREDMKNEVMARLHCDDLLTKQILEELK